MRQPVDDMYLTLTNVVFECYNKTNEPIQINDLTLTNVVFEFLGNISMKGGDKNLTLTNVVFEFYIFSFFKNLMKFNFNKCCI